jgi:hypothetical protein
MAVEPLSSTQTMIGKVDTTFVPVGSVTVCAVSAFAVMVNAPVEVTSHQAPSELDCPFDAVPINAIDSS